LRLTRKPDPNNVLLFNKILALLVNGTLLVLGYLTVSLFKNGESVMERIKAIRPENAGRKVRELLDRINEDLGMIPNLMKVMANSTAVLEAYLRMSDVLSKGSLSLKLREQLALFVSELNSCTYCIAAHSAVGRVVGLTEEELMDSRRGVSPSRETEAALQFARVVLEKRGHVSGEDFTRLRDVGYSDEQISEMIMNVTLTVFTNYLNNVAGTEVDFPPEPVLESTQCTG
jgi:uncharacterized peroxidase-related enzyme